MYTRTYGYYSMNLAGGKIKVPLKFYLATDAEFKLPTKQGYNNKEVRTIKVVPTDEFTQQYYSKNARKIPKKDDIEETIGWTEVETYLPGDTSGTLKKLEEFPGLSELMEQNKSKNSERDVEVLGIYNKSELSWGQFNGRQFYTISGEKGAKEPKNNDLQIYGCLSNYLKETDSYILIRFFTKSGQELGAVYPERGLLKVSGLYPDNIFRDAKEGIEVQPSENIMNLIQTIMRKCYASRENIDGFVLDWVDFYRESLAKKGVFKKFEKTPVSNAVGSTDDLANDLANLLNSL